MTIYDIRNFDYNHTEDYIHSCAEEQTLEIALTEASLWEAYRIHCGKSIEPYCKKSRCIWPLDKKCFYDKLFGDYYKKKYGTFENYKNSNEYVVKYEIDDDCGMCQLYSLLDNFHNYIGAFKWQEYLVILSVGSSYTHYYTPSNYYNIDMLSEGFSVVINTTTNDITLIALDEDDGNYWGEKTLPYSRLSIYDRGIVSSIVNDIEETKLNDKNKLIELLIKSK